MRWMSIIFAAVLSACGTAAPATTASTTPAAALPSARPATTTTASTTPAAADSGVTTTDLPPLQGLELEPVDIEVRFPVLVFSSGPDAFVVDKVGMILPITGGTPVLDIRDKVRNDGEQGMLGAAFHPRDGSLLFVHYTDRNGNTTVSSFKVEGDVADRGSEQVVFQVQQPAGNHNGGMIQFDAEGHLYIGLGDGGGANDRFGNGQNLGSTLGSILRLSISDAAGYTIPTDNPFVDGAQPEIWAWGLRNPWRFWIDESGGVMVIADVGQNQYEEVDIIPMAGGGQNLGWPITEGQHCFAPSSGCDTSGVTLPVLEVSHDDAGSCSITGGIVYRGSKIPELSGTYFFSDYCAGYLRGFALNDPSAITDYTDVLGGPIGRVTSFGQGADGEMYITTVDAVFKLVPRR